MGQGVFRRRNNRRVSGGPESHRLKWWGVCFSGVLHLVLLGLLLWVPPSTARRAALPPVYTVDLVAPGPAPVAKAPPAAGVAAPEPPREDTPAPKVSAPAPPEKPRKKVVAPEKPAPTRKVAKPQEKPTPKPKPKVVKRKKPAPKKSVATKVTRKQVTTKRPAKKTPKVARKKTEAKSAALRDSRLSKRLRQRRIEEVVAERAERGRLQRAARREGGGAEAPRTEASGNGGVVRSVEFLAYRGQLFESIKERWTWIGKHGELEVTVRFGVSVEGEIFGLKLLKTSGDASFDESVVRAVRRVSLLPPPPDLVQKFRQVTITVRPDDLDGQGPVGLGPG